jgi:hypothetical protein
LLHDLPDIALALIVLGAFVLVWRTGGDDPAWHERWRALSPADRTRIARAARNGSLLASQEEIELAAGYARRDRRRRVLYSLLGSVRFPLGVALIVGGVVADAIILIVFGAVFLLGGLWALVQDHRISRAERETIARDRPL